MEKIITQELFQENVNLRGKNLGDCGINYLCHRDTSKVRQLYLNFNLITKKGIIHFKRANWECLTHLSLNSNDIGNRGCLFLSRASIKKLQSLSLFKNELDSSGLDHLTKGRWKELKEIWLRQNHICCNAVASASNANWNNLARIELRDNCLKREDYIAIILSFNAIKFVTLDKFVFNGNEKSLIKNKYGEIHISST